MQLRVLFLAGWWVATAFMSTYAATYDLRELNAALEQGQYKDVEMLASNALAEPGLDRLSQCRLYIARGLARQAQGLFDNALVDFTHGVTANVLPATEHAAALFDRGVTLDSLGHLDDAVADYSASLSIMPGASNVLNNRANIYRRQGRLADARRDYLAALVSDQVHAQYPYYGLGQIAEAEGDTRAARDFYAKAVAADPNYQLAVDRLQALGTADWAQADPGVIVLRPPPTQAAIVLHPPLSKLDVAGSVDPKTANLHLPSRQVPSNPVTVSPEGASLRPTIVENRGQAATSGTLVQLGAWRSEPEAQTGWSLAKARAGGLLDGLSPIIVTADLPGRGRYYRLRIAPQEPVSQFCTALVAKNIACFPTRD